MSTPVRHFCAIADARYVSRALALLESLRAHADPFRLFVLCMDDHAQASMTDRPGVVALRLDDLEREQPELLAAKATRAWHEYCYTCKPALLSSLFRRNPDVELLTYLDADLFFFSSPEPLYATLGTRGIGILEHRFPDSLRHLESYGRFNAGWVAFRREPEALRCLERWREQCLEWCYDRIEDDRFTDQRYLDAWPRLYEGVAVLEHEGADLAPWNVGRHALRIESDQLRVDERPLVFYHFHGLHVARPGPVRSGLAPYGVALTPTLRRHVYRPYVRTLCALEHGLHPAVVRWLRAESSLPIALLHLLASFEDADALLGHLDAGSAGLHAPDAARLASLRAFVDAHRSGIALVREMGALHARAEAELPDRGVAALATLYDRLAQIDPGTAVALYAFGDARILAEATGEVLAYLGERRILSPASRLLDLGCGMGRLLEACAPACAQVTGVDVSPQMVALAAERVRRIPGASARLVNGLDLRDLEDGAFDVVLAADSWPHVLSLGAEVVLGLGREVARVLAPGGDFVVLNYSYRGDAAADRRDVAELAAACGFSVVEDGSRPFALWDATAFRLRRSVGIP